MGDQKNLYFENKDIANRMALYICDQMSQAERLQFQSYASSTFKYNAFMDKLHEVWNENEAKEFITDKFLAKSTLSIHSYRNPDEEISRKAIASIFPEDVATFEAYIASDLKKRIRTNTRETWSLVDEPEVKEDNSAFNGLVARMNSFNSEEDMIEELRKVAQEEKERKEDVDDIIDNDDSDVYDRMNDLVEEEQEESMDDLLDMIAEEIQEETEEVSNIVQINMVEEPEEPEEEVEEYYTYDTPDQSTFETGETLQDVLDVIEESHKPIIQVNFDKESSSKPTSHKYDSVVFNKEYPVKLFSNSLINFIKNEHKHDLEWDRTFCIEYISHRDEAGLITITKLSKLADTATFVPRVFSEKNNQESSNIPFITFHGIFATLLS